MLKKLNNEELNLLLDDFLLQVENNFSIDRAILYGSYAKGLATELSDVDLLIISKDLPQKSTKGMNGYRILSTLDKVYPDIELIAAHPDSIVNNEITKPFYDEVFSTGRTLR